MSRAKLLPGNRAVVHHILAFARPKGSRSGVEAQRGFLVGYVPGSLASNSQKAWRNASQRTVS